MKTPVERFWEKVQKTDGGCWLWTASSQAGGYGHFKDNGRLYPSHKWLWEQLNGPVPKGLELDHLCRNPSCVNPDHLEAVTHKENCRRGNVGQNNRDRTHCSKGHEYTEANTGFKTNRGLLQRRCRQCDCESSRRRRVKT